MRAKWTHIQLLITSGKKRAALSKLLKEGSRARVACSKALHVTSTMLAHAQRQSSQPSRDHLTKVGF